MTGFLQESNSDGEKSFWVMGHTATGDAEELKRSAPPAAARLLFATNENRFQQMKREIAPVGLGTEKRGHFAGGVEQHIA